VCDSKKNCYLLSTDKGTVTGHASLEEASEYLFSFARQVLTCLPILFLTYYRPRVTELKDKDELGKYIRGPLDLRMLRNGKHVCYGLLLTRRKGRELRSDAKSRYPKYYENRLDTNS